MHPRFAIGVLVVVMVAACGQPPTSGSPVGGHSSPSRATEGTASPGTAVVNPGASQARPTALPVAPPPPVPTVFPVRVSAGRTGAGILMAPGPEGTLYVAIPRPRGTVLALLDATGRLRDGWPLALPSSTGCDFLAAAPDGSVRVICDATDVVGPVLDPPVRRAYALRHDGSQFPGWPVDGRFSDTARVDGSRLLVLSSVAPTEPGRLARAVRVTTIEVDATVRDGKPVPLEDPEANAWVIASDGVAYGTRLRAGVGADADPGEMMAIDAAGLRPGWPVLLAGSPSVPAPLPDGRVVVTIGFLDRDASRVLAFDVTGSVAGGSPELPIATAAPGVDCPLGSTPDGPFVSGDGMVFVRSGYDGRIYSLDAGLRVTAGWPLTPPRDLLAAASAPCPPGARCCARPLTTATPAAGSMGDLFLPLEPGSTSRGGGLLAVGHDGQPLVGWPLELRRQGAGFWSVVVGPDDTAYALALEPAAGEDTSATILAIRPGGTVDYRATVIEP